MSALENAIRQSAALRGKGEFQAAINLIDEALANASGDDDVLVIANLEGLKAAEEAGFSAEAKRFAVAIKATDPDMPRIQKYF
ncbi:hypothetical protein [Ensifer sp. ENS12]|jgi:hypothetical protein|uniref:hypothetical protein n=1 Tax=Ensifer sp. ENS12 TaxID=2854774 RepID=UPI000DE5AF1C|nr:hypothetical protein [Ensifer sp. ENS12]MBV7522288.1 hypothetical protein [Ensifer sp. ENS12]